MLDCFWGSRVAYGMFLPDSQVDGQLSASFFGKARATGKGPGEQF